METKRKHISWIIYPLLINYYSRHLNSSVIEDYQVLCRCVMELPFLISKNTFKVFLLTSSEISSYCSKTSSLALYAVSNTNIVAVCRETFGHCSCRTHSTFTFQKYVLKLIWEFKERPGARLVKLKFLMRGVSYFVYDAYITYFTCMKITVKYWYRGNRFVLSMCLWWVDLSVRYIGKSRDSQEVN